MNMVIKTEKRESQSHFGDSSRIADFVKDDQRALRVADALLDSGAYLIDTSMNEEEYYTWKSGVRAPCYCNCRNAISDPVARKLIVKEMSEMISQAFPTVDILVGVATAGIPWATSAADYIGKAAAYVRSEKKSYGVGGYVQGAIKDGQKVVIVDDLVASGGSLKMAVECLNAEVNVEILGIASIINWGFMRMRENLLGVNFVALTSYPQVVMAATLRGKVADEDFQRLLSFYANPSGGY